MDWNGSNAFLWSRSNLVQWEFGRHRKRNISPKWEELDSVRAHGYRGHRLATRSKCSVEQGNIDILKLNSAQCAIELHTMCTLPPLRIMYTLLWWEEAQMLQDRTLERFIDIAKDRTLQTSTTLHYFRKTNPQLCTIFTNISATLIYENLHGGLFSANDRKTQTCSRSPRIRWNCSPLRPCSISGWFLSMVAFSSARSCPSSAACQQARRAPSGEWQPPRATWIWQWHLAYKACIKVTTLRIGCCCVIAKQPQTRTPQREHALWAKQRFWVWTAHLSKTASHK